jgi:membrane protein YdbS with pleckstrin-like domain
MSVGLSGMVGGVQPAEPLRLRPPRHLVSRRAIAWWTTQAALEVAAVLVPLVVGLAVWADARPWLAGVTAAVVVLGLGYVLVMPRWRFRVHRWETTDDAVYTSAGWIRQEWRVAPMSRIQTVDTERGPLQQLFGLATVTVTTASAAGALRLAGLDHELAEGLVEQLTETTQATPGDAT